MRKFIFNFTEKLPKKNWPEKIYLKRNSGVRKVINASELETHLIEQGFVVVEPEKLTFLQQAMLFSQAKSIIGASGASLANMIFTPSDACVQIFIGKYPNTSYWYWQNIACTSGNSVVYILGRTSENGNGIHSDFTIDLTDIPSTVGK
jgi:capsular polysaccharide biosynthesis protein